MERANAGRATGRGRHVMSASNLVLSTGDRTKYEAELADPKKRENAIYDLRVAFGLEPDFTPLKPETIAAVKAAQIAGAEFIKKQAEARAAQAPKARTAPSPAPVKTAQIIKLPTPKKKARVHNTATLSDRAQTIMQHGCIPDYEPVAGDKKDLSR